MVKKQILANLLLVVSSLVFAGVLSELVLRALGYETLYVNPERAIFWKYHPLWGWHHDPGQHGIFESAEFRIAVSINQKGLRDRDYSYERTSEKKRILVLGDSFVWGFGVEQDQIFTEQLEDLLPNVEVINAGVSGYSTDQELLWLKSEGVKYDPDLGILVVRGIDDSLNHLERVYVVYYKPRFTFGENGHLELQNVPVPQASAFERSLYLGRRHSSLVNFLIQNVRPTILQKLHGQGSFETQKLETFRESDASEQFTLTLALIDEIRRVAETENAQLMIVTNSIFWWPHQLDATYEELVRALRDNYPYVIDIEASTGYSSAQMTIPHDGHWNQDGHRFVAEQLLKFIEENRLLEPEKPRSHSY
jgi:hypothetical protein